MAGFLTVAEVADYLKTTTTTVYRWLKEGRLTAVKIGKEWRIDETLLGDVLRRNNNVNMQEASGAFWSLLRKSEHIMLLTDKNSEVAQFEVSFYKKALEEGAMLMKGCWWEDADEVVDRYARLGMDAELLIKDGIFSVFNMSGIYENEGIGGVIGAWRSSLENAVDRGASRLWASGSPNMECCGKDPLRLLDFESKLNDAIRNAPVVGVCPYSLEDESNREHFEKMVALMNKHSGVAFYSNHQYSLLRH